jgi:hypothetical protein
MCQNLGDPCSECASVQCPAEYCACFGDPSCVSLVLCVQGCGSDLTCDQNCFTTNPGAISESFLLGGCVANHCPVCMDSMTLTPCQTCLFTSCASAMNTCVADPDCASLAQCIEACTPGDMTCSMTCQQMYPNGVQKVVPVATCMQGTCASSCM